jgi:carboxy-cis,cis-muconate cyclase
MRSFPVALAASLLSCVALVRSTHHLFVGSFESNHIFALAYNAETNAITTEKSITAHGGHPVLGLNHNKTVLYAGEQDGWSSYKVKSHKDLSFMTNITTLKGRCHGEVFKHGQTNLFVSKNAPFNVHGSGRSPCGSVIDVKVDGSLNSIVQKIAYRNTSRVLSVTMDKEGKWLYSADQQANGIWIHRVDPTTGKLDRRSFTQMPPNYTKPQRLVLHPAGNYLYVLLSQQSSVALFQITHGAGAAGRPQLKFTNTVFSLLPKGKLYVRMCASRIRTDC